MVEIEFDPAKEATNFETHGISLSRVRDFDFETAIVIEDRRRDYGETRFIALGYIDDRLHVLVFTRRPPLLRPISLRKANPREAGRYATG